MTDASLRLLAVAEASPLGEFQRAQADLLRARIAFTVNRGRDAPLLLLKAATNLQSLDVRLARDTYLDALRAGWFAAHLASGTDLRDIACGRPRRAGACTANASARISCSTAWPCVTPTDTPRERRC